MEEINKKITVPICEKVTLTIEEAAAYSSIGICKLYDLCREQKCNFVLHIGKRILIKRKQFEEYIDKEIEI